MCETCFERNQQRVARLEAADPDFFRELAKQQNLE